MRRTQSRSGVAHPSPWQLLAEINLPATSDLQSLLKAWLPDTLLVLQLDAGPSARIIEATLEIVRRIQKEIRSQSDPSILSIRVFVLADALAGAERNRVWGFFHVARIAEEEHKRKAASQAIDFYLYPEG